MEDKKLSEVFSEAFEVAFRKSSANQNKNEAIVVTSSFLGYAYDQKHYKIYVDEERIGGFAAHKKVEIINTTEGIDFFIHLQATSPFAGKFKDAVGAAVNIRAEYDPPEDLSDYGPALNHQAMAIVKSVSVSAGDEVPTFVVHFSGSSYKKNLFFNSSNR